VGSIEKRKGIHSMYVVVIVIFIVVVIVVGIL